MRVFFLVTGLLLTAIGIVGAFVPVLPTFDFLFLALLCFGKSSIRLESWLLNNPRFGAPLRRWKNDRTISKAHKAQAVVLVWISIGVGVFLATAWWLRAVLLIIAAGVTWFVITRSSQVAARDHALVRSPDRDDSVPAA